MYKQSTAGGGPATPLAESLVSNIFQPLVGTAGNMDRTNPVGQTQGIMGLLQDILSPGGGQMGANLSSLIQSDIDKQVGATRARFTAGGGVSRGTPAAVAEGKIRAEGGPRIAKEVGQLQLQTLLPILQLISSFASQGVPQAQNIFQPNPWLTVAQALGGVAQGAGSLATGIKAGG